MPDKIFLEDNPIKAIS